LTRFLCGRGDSYSNKTAQQNSGRFHLVSSPILHRKGVLVPESILSLPPARPNFWETAANCYLSGIAWLIGVRNAYPAALTELSATDARLSLFNIKTSHLK
jgi:hypothetical protein